MNKIILIFAIISLFSLQTSAAEIHGRSYSPELGLLNGIIVEINTQPKQIAVTDPSYSFTVNPGEYTIKAKSIDEEYYLEENVTVKGEGRFLHDLILFYTIDYEEPELPGLEDISLDQKNKNSSTILILLFIIAVLIGFFIQKISRRKNKIKEQSKEPELKEDLAQLLKILSQHNGRMNQKDLRKNLNLSEAKVSLMISELESLNKIKRIKKGRANIIILS